MQSAPSSEGASLCSSSSSSPRPPPNLSWCEENVLCACAFPSERDHLKYLAENNVECLVSLTAERQVEGWDENDVRLQVVAIPVRDYTPPTIEQIEHFLHCVTKVKARGKAVCVHCAHGLGRTGTMLACYFIQTHHMSPDDAIAHVRALRPGSIETTEQELQVFKFHSHWQAKLEKGDSTLSALS